MNTIALGTPYKQCESEKNRKAVLVAVGERYPDWMINCKPYINVLPIKAWNQRGFRVKKGEKAIQVWTMIPKTKKNDDGQEEIIGKRSVVANVFALPQVEQF